jgi:hypothetical protein
MATLRGPGTADCSAEATARSGGGHYTGIDEALTAIDKGLRRHWGPWHGQGGDFFEEKAPFGITRLYHNVQPFAARVGTASRLISDGIGFVKVSRA